MAVSHFGQGALFDLFQGGPTHEGFFERVVTHRPVAAALSFFDQFGGRSARDDQIAHLLGDLEIFVHADPSRETRAEATRTSLAAIEKHIIGIGVFEVGLKFSARRGVGFFARGADAPHQALGKNTDDGGCHHMRGDAELEQAGDGLDRVIGMERAEHQVTREGGFGGNSGSFAVTNFSDQRDVRILSQHAAKQALEGQSDAVIDLVLGDRRQPDFNRVLQGCNVEIGFVDLGEARIESSGFTTTSRAAAKEDTIGPSDPAFNGATDGVREPDGGELGGGFLPRGTEQTQHGFLPIDGGHRRGAKGEAFDAQLDFEGAVLGDARCRGRSEL